MSIRRSEVESAASMSCKRPCVLSPQDFWNLTATNKHACLSWPASGEANTTRTTTIAHDDIDSKISAAAGCPRVTFSFLESVDSDAMCTIASYFAPRDAARLSTTNKDFQRRTLFSHVRAINGKFRSGDHLVRNLHHCHRLETLDLKGNKFTGTATMNALTSFIESSEYLERLDLSGLSITSAGVQSIARSLERRHIDDAAAAADDDEGIKGKSSSSSGSERKAIRNLALAVNNLGDDGAATLGNLCKSGALAKLEAINLSNTVIGHRGFTSLTEGLGHCPELRCVNLSNNPLDNLMMTGRASSTPWTQLGQALGPSLEHLSIFNALLSCTAIQSLVCQWSCPNLVNLNLSWNRMGTEGCRALAESLSAGTCPNLTTLNISHNHIQGDALPELTKALSSPAIRPNLRHLNLGWNPINSVLQINPNATEQRLHPPPLHISHLGMSIAACPQLESLSLCSVELGTEAAIALATGLSTGRSASCQRLTHLNVSWNHMGPVGALAFARLVSQSSCPKLTCLDISYCGIGDRGAHAMAQQWTESADFVRPELLVHIVGNQISSVYHHFIHAFALGQLLAEIADSGANNMIPATLDSSPSPPILSTTSSSVATMALFPPPPRRSSRKNIRTSSTLSPNNQM